MSYYSNFTVMESRVSSKDNILIVCSSEDKIDSSKSIIENLRDAIGAEGNLFVEKVSQLTKDKLQPSSFHKIFYGYIDVTPSVKQLNDAVLDQLIKLVRPKGQLFIKKSQEEDCQTASLLLNIKFSGFVNINERFDEITCEKPDYEVGSAVSIKSGQVQDSKAIWQLAADNLLDDDELIDDNALLTESDLKKPDPESLKVCGTTGKRKACANCSCGLADELAKEEVQAIKSNSQNAKSSCGSCYLGDAFRCASCPYLGMPAFKPGEKVTIDVSSDL